MSVYFLFVTVLDNLILLTPLFRMPTNVVPNTSQLESSASLEAPTGVGDQSSAPSSSSNADAPRLHGLSSVASVTSGPIISSITEWWRYGAAIFSSAKR